MAASKNGIFPNNGVAPGSPNVAAGALETADATCEALFYPDVCNPRINVSSINTIISEIVKAVNCAGFQYDCDRLDNLCEAIFEIARIVYCDSPAVTDAGDAFVILCDDGTPKKILAEDLVKFCVGDVPDLGDTCGEVSTLVLVDDGSECGSIAKYRSSRVPSRNFGYYTVSGPENPDNVTGLIIPESFGNPNGYYRAGDYVADGGTSSTEGAITGRRPANNINEQRVVNSLLGQVSFNNNCPQTYAFNFYAAFARESSAENAYARSAQIGTRVRVNGGPWEYTFVPGTGQLSLSEELKSIAGSQEVNASWPLPAGNIDVQVFYVAPDSPENARILANTRQPGFGTSQPRGYLRPIY